MIEFVGLPGSGKSTIERALREALAAEGHKPLAPLGFFRWARLGRYKSPFTPIVLVMRVLAGGLATWGFFFKMLWWCLATPPSHYKHLGTALVLTAKRALLIQTLRHCSDGYILCNEFLVNNVAKYIAIGQFSCQDSSFWFSNFYRDVQVLFVYVDIPIDESLRRLESRAKHTSHVQKLNKAQATEYLKRLKGVSERCISHAASFGDSRIIRINGDRSIKIIIEQLLGEIVGQLESGGRQAEGQLIVRSSTRPAQCEDGGAYRGEGPGF